MLLEPARRQGVVTVGEPHWQEKWLSVQANRWFIPYVFGGAMVVAPFLALLYDVTFGIGVLAAALAATAVLALDAAKAAAPALRQRLLVLASVNGVLAIVAAGFVVTRLMG